MENYNKTVLIVSFNWLKWSRRKYQLIHEKWLPKRGLELHWAGIWPPDKNVYHKLFKITTTFFFSPINRLGYSSVIFHPSAPFCCKLHPAIEFELNILLPIISSTIFDIGIDFIVPQHQPLEDKIKFQWPEIV